VDLLSVLGILAAAIGWGHLLLPPGPAGRDAAFVRLCVGLAAVSQVAGLLGLLGFARPGTLLSVVYLGAAAGAARRVFREPGVGLTNLADPLSSPGKATTSLTLCLALVTLWRALEGDRGADPYHAYLPKAFLLQGSVAPFQGVLESTYPMSWELLNLVAFAHGTGGQPGMLTAAAHVLAAWGAALAVFPFGGRRAAGVGALFVLSNPLLARVGSTSHIEAGQALLLVGALVAAVRHQRDRSSWSLLSSCGLLGVLSGTKETALLLLVVPALAVLFFPRPRRRRAAPARVRAAALALLLIFPAPWVLRKAAATGNPFYPLLVDRLPTEPAFAETGRAFASRHPESVSRPSLDLLVRMLDALSVEGGSGEVLMGLLAGALLLIPSARRRWGPLLAGAAVGFAVMLPLVHGGRFAGPAMPLFSLVASALFAAALRALGRGRQRTERLSSLLLAATLAWRYPLHVAPMYAQPRDLLRLPPFGLAARQERQLEVDASSEALRGVSGGVNSLLSRRDHLLVVSRPRHLEFLDVPFFPPSHFAPDMRGVLADGSQRHRPFTALLVFREDDAAPGLTDAQPVLLETTRARLVRPPASLSPPEP
jgi:hypothetical protein